MTTLTQVKDHTQASAEWEARMRNQIIRDWVRNIIVYILLTAVALFMLFPFLYMFFTSLKTSTDVFRTPPRLLPYSGETIEYEGEQLPLYNLEIEGTTRQLVLVDDSVRFGFFTTEAGVNPAEPEASEMVASLPLAEAVDVGEEVTIEGEDFDVYEITLDGETQRVLLANRTALGRFIDPNDAAFETYANVRLNEGSLVETVDFQWENYNAVLSLRNLDRSLVNTALVTVLVTAGQVTTSLLGGYAFSRIRFAGRNAVFMLYLGTIMIPFVVLIIPLYQLMVIIGWQNHLVSLILPWVFTAYGTFLMRQFFITIPKELEEAALLDGLGRFGILWRIFVPLSAPAIATQAIITFLYAWNSFIWPLVIIGEGNTQNHVVTLSLIQLQNAASSEPNLVLTGAAVAILPPLVLFILAQRYFIEGIASTGLKG
jgi:multiple sugar transport system permease protein